MGLQSVPTMEALADEALRRMWRFSVNDLMKARDPGILLWPGMKLTGTFQGGSGRGRGRLIRFVQQIGVNVFHFILLIRSISISILE